MTEGRQAAEVVVQGMVEAGWDPDVIEEADAIVAALLAQAGPDDPGVVVLRDGSVRRVVEFAPWHRPPCAVWWGPTNSCTCVPTPLYRLVPVSGDGEEGGE